MAEQRPFITVKLDLSNPVEVYDFVDLFASIASQYEKFIRAEYPDAPPEGKMFIKEVRRGSIIIDLFTGAYGDLVQAMDDILIITGFASLFSKRVRSFIMGMTDIGASKSDLKDYLSTVRAVASDPDGKAEIETAIFKDGVWQREVVFNFRTPEAQAAARTIEAQKAELDKSSAADYSRKLMYFKRSDIGDVSVGKRSGERVIIEDIMPKDLPLIYASSLTEERIKHEIRESDENIFKKGFVVDVNVQSRGGRPVAYAITHVHQVIDLPGE